MLIISLGLIFHQESMEYYCYKYLNLPNLEVLSKLLETMSNHSNQIEGFIRFAIFQIIEEELLFYFDQYSITSEVTHTSLLEMIRVCY